jgi:hypothetical protein
MKSENEGGVVKAKESGQVNEGNGMQVGCDTEDFGKIWTRA